MCAATIITERRRRRSLRSLIILWRTLCAATIITKRRLRSLPTYVCRGGPLCPPEIIIINDFCSGPHCGPYILKQTHIKYAPAICLFILHQNIRHHNVCNRLNNRLLHHHNRSHSHHIVQVKVLQDQFLYHNEDIHLLHRSLLI